MINKFLRKFFSDKSISQFGLLIWKVRENIKDVFLKNKFLIKLYYGILSNEFIREKYAVGLGIRKKKNEKIDKYMISRNIHRLEKGISMKSRRKLFGEGYINETYEEFLKIDPSNNNRFNWYRDVLDEYFRVTGDSEIISPLRSHFEINFKNFKNFDYRPFERKKAEKLTIDYNDLLSLSRRRRSIRWYLDKPVPRETIEKALKIGLYAPSACNRQPFEFLVYDDKEKINKIASIPMGTAGFYHQFPMIIVVVGDLSAYDSERDRHVIYIDGSLCAMGFVLALETLELSSCMINWPDIEPLEQKLNSELKLPEYKRPLFLISVGYANPDGLIPYSMKKTPKEIITYNK